MSRKKLPSNGIVYSTDPSYRLQEEEAAPETTPAPEKQVLYVRLDTKQRGGKAVTLIENFAGTEEDLETLGKQLKTHCGTGGSVKDRQIIIQGDQRVKVTEWLKKKGFGKVKS